MVASKSITEKILGNLNRTQDKKAKNFERLSSGKRINKAQDDAAALAIVGQLTADIAVLGQASRNVNDGLSAAAIQESSLSQINDINIRQSELAQQSANGVLNDDQRVALQGEFDALQSEKERIVQTTTFNDINLLAGGSINVQAGTGSDPSSQIALPTVDATSLAVTGDISNQANALAALDEVTAQIDTVNQLVGQIGGATSRLQTAGSNIVSQREQSFAARARLEDADIAQEVADLTANNIREQGSVAVLAQGKLSAQNVLKLLQ